MSLRILGDGPIEDALIAAGIADDNTTRVVIDLQVGHIPRVHIERHGDDKLVEVIQTLEGVEIVREERPPHRQPCLSKPPTLESYDRLFGHVHACIHEATQPFGTTLEHACRCGVKWTEPSEETTDAGLQ